MDEDEDKLIKSVVGKPYSEETKHLLRYGGTVDSKGIIVEAWTREEADARAPKCNFALGRVKNPWARISALAFMKEMCDNNTIPEGSIDPGVVLNVRYRHEVASRFWWTLEWTGYDGRRHSASAQTFNLLFERAADTELVVRRRMEEKE